MSTFCVTVQHARLFRARTHLCCTCGIYSPACYAHFQHSTSLKPDIGDHSLTYHITRKKMCVHSFNSFAFVASVSKHLHWENWRVLILHLCSRRFKVNPHPHLMATRWDTEVCSAPSSPWWRPRAQGVCTADWWQGCTGRWVLPRSALACMTPWSSSTPEGRKVCDRMFATVKYCRLSNSWIIVQSL